MLIVKETTKGNSAQESPSFWQKVKNFFGVKGCNTTINFDPSSTQGGKNENGSNERPAFVGLGHEMGHADAMDKGIQSYDMGTGNAGTIPSAEKQSMAAENAIRKEHNLPSRPSYY